MNDLLSWLQGGDLRSDGLSQEVVRFVLSNPGLMPDLFEGLIVEDPVIRGRTADALEHLARHEGEPLRPFGRRLLKSLAEDPIPMVRWHLAMLAGHMALTWETIDQAVTVLLKCLDDRSVFVISWAIVSLCIYVRFYPDLHEGITPRIAKLANHPSVAIRSKVKNALVVLGDETQPFPKGWVKSPSIQDALQG